MKLKVGITQQLVMKVSHNEFYEYLSSGLEVLTLGHSQPDRYGVHKGSAFYFVKNA